MEEAETRVNAKASSIRGASLSPRCKAKRGPLAHLPSGGQDLAHGIKGGEMGAWSCMS